MKHRPLSIADFRLLRTHVVLYSLTLSSFVSGHDRLVHASLARGIMKSRCYASEFFKSSRCKFVIISFLFCQFSCILYESPRIHADFFAEFLFVIVYDFLHPCSRSGARRQWPLCTIVSVCHIDTPIFLIFFVSFFCILPQNIIVMQFFTKKTETALLQSLLPSLLF